MSMASKLETTGAHRVERAASTGASHATGSTGSTGSARAGYGSIHRAETDWGYALSCAPERARMLHTLEIFLWGGALLSSFLGLLLWVWPGATVDAPLLGIKLGLTLCFALFAVALGSLARRGMVREIQVDMRRAQLRVTMRNRAGTRRLQTVVGFDEIGSVFLRRSFVPLQVTHLNVRFGTEGKVIALLDGTQSGLRALWQDLSADIQAAGQTRRKAAARAEATPRPATPRPVRRITPRRS